MYLRTVLATSAGIPFFAAFIAERDGRVGGPYRGRLFLCRGPPGAPSCSETGTALNSRTNTAESLVEWRAEAVGTSGGESHGRVCAEPRRLGA
jgi:hypothetical protein